MPAPAWVVNYDAVDEAREILGIKHDVYVLNRWMRWSWGRYLGLEDEYWDCAYHSISIASNLLGLGRASGVLWHELTHAKQREEWGYDFGDEYDSQLIAAGLEPNVIEYGQVIPEEYRNIPFEKEATENSDKYKNHLLTRYRKKRRTRMTPCAINIEHLNDLRI